MRTGIVPTVLVAAMALGGCSGAADANGTPDPARVQRITNDLIVDVGYYVSGTAGSVSVTAETPTGTTQADTGVPLVNQSGTRGLRYTFTPGSFVYVSAQNQSDTGSVTCRIKVGDLVISENTTTASYGIATCKGRA